MKEIQFLHKNIAKWEEFEKLLAKESGVDPDKLSDLYIRLTDDLAYSRTYYPGTQTTHYLNQLTTRAHGLLYKNQPIQRGRLKKFWLVEYPLLFYSVRREVGISFVIFFISVLIGIISTRGDYGFARIIMGDSYINMTLSNIENDDPMAVYKSMEETEMFLGITINNIRVSFFAFVSGIITSLGTGYVLVRNGIMLGTFQTFIADQGYLLESVATIWIHGTLEIFAIIVAGAGGLILGNSIVFPGTYKRSESFRKGALKGVRLVLGLVPVFVIAGFLEGFVTRHTEFPYALRFTIIGLSLLFIFFYFFVYPKKLTQKHIENGKRID